MSLITGDTFAHALLAHLLQNTALPNIGDANGLQPSATAGSLYIGLHTDTVTVGGPQTQNETTYTGYNRIAIVRSALGWTVNNRQGSNAANVVPSDSAGNNQTIKTISIGTAANGAGEILWAIDLTAPFTTTNGPLPIFPPGFIQVSL